MTMIFERDFAQRTASPWAALLRLLRRIDEKLATWRRCKQAEAALRAASDRQLRDIGIDRTEITSVVWGHGRDRRRCNDARN